MIRVTWDWLGQGPALDLADTVTVAGGVEHDLLERPGEYERWAAAEAAALGLPEVEAQTLIEARPALLGLRNGIREVLFATAAGRPLPDDAVASLNRASRAAPEWTELDPASGTLRAAARAARVDRVAALYARSAMALVADHAGSVRVCPAPSCGMFYLPRRADQHWCSTQCGTRARVARHAAARRLA